MLILRRGALSLMSIALAFCGLAATAGAAGMSVTAAVKAQDHAINHSAAVKKLKHLHVTTPAQAKKVIPDLQALDRKLDHAGRIVAKATATTPKQKVGQKEWVAGVRELARGFSQLTVALKDIEHGNKIAAKAQALTAARTIVKAEALGVKADRALGLPTTD